MAEGAAEDHQPAMVRSPHLGGPVRDAVVAGHAGDLETASRLSEDPDPSVRAAALGALHRMGALDAAALVSAMSDLAPVVRRRACELAGRGPVDDAPVETVGALVRIVSEDTDPSVVESAAWALGEAGSACGGAAVRALEGVVREHADPLCREAAVAALGRDRRRDRARHGPRGTGRQGPGSTPGHHRPRRLRRPAGRRRAAAVPGGPGLAGAAGGRGSTGPTLNRSGAIEARSGVGGDEELAQLVEGLEAVPGAEHDALQRRVDEVHGTAVSSSSRRSSPAACRRRPTRWMPSTMRSWASSGGAAPRQFTADGDDWRTCSSMAPRSSSGDRTTVLGSPVMRSRPRTSALTSPL